MHQHTCEDCYQSFVCADSIIDCRTEYFTCADCAWSNFFGFLRLVIWATIVVVILVALFG